MLYNNPEIPWDTHLKSIGTSISVKKQEENSGHRISSGDESWFPVFDWRGKPTFHKHLKMNFLSGICMWEGPCVLCFKVNIPRDALIRRRPNFPAESKCMLIIHITRWKDVWILCKDAPESPRSPPHLEKGPQIPLTHREARAVHCFKCWRCLRILEYC